MVRALMMSCVLACAFAFAAAAQDQPKQQPRSRKWETSAPQTPGKQTVIVTGCVLQGSQPGTFILTVQQNPLASHMSQRVTGQVPTPTYQLFGHTSELQGLVGHSVQVKGTTDKKPEKTVQSGHEKTTESPKAEGTSGKKPTVTTDTKEKIELRRLDVQNLQAVQGGCGGQ